MSATPQDSAASSPRRRLRDANWMPLLLSIAGLLIVGMIGYFGLQFLKGSTFREERAFRVLADVSRQFNNMQETLGSLLTLVPESVVGTGCVIDTNEQAKYVEKLDLSGLELGRDIDLSKDGVTVDRFDVALDDTRRSFVIRMPNALTRTCALQVEGNLQQHLPAFVTQQYFDTVLVTLRDGTLLATISNRSNDRTRLEIHPDTSESRPVIDARALLLRASDLADPTNSASFWDTEKQKPERKYERPFHTVAFRQSIGGGKYVVSILPFTPSFPVHAKAATAVSSDTSKASESISGDQTVLYLVGLKREDVTQQAADALGPAGTLAVTTLVLLGVLTWPLIGLRLASRHSAISGFQVFGVIVSLLLVPVVLTACGVWLWSNLRLQIWADNGAENYAAQLERYVQSEIAEAAWLLGRYRELANSPQGCTSVGSAPIRGSDSSEGAWMARVIVRADQNGGDPKKTSCRLYLQYPYGGRTSSLMNWSPVRTAVQLDAKGDGVSPRITAFGAVPTKWSLNVKDRAYFKALREGQSWRGPEDSPADAPEFVAQRLFNRSDAARVLQIAVPKETSRVWEGAVTGDTRVYGLTAGIRPPLLRFAIVDRQNGEVLFHSEDERSLSENLLVETDRNTSLQQALQSGGWKRRRIALEDHFSAQYMGDPHRFYYRSMNGIPWGIAVFYSTRSVSAISLDATIATLALCIGCITLAVFLLVATAFFGSVRPDKQLLSAIWPQWEWRHHYARIAIALSLFGFVLATALIFSLRHGQWALTMAGLVAVTALIVAACLRLRWLAPQVRSQRAYRAFYVWAVVAFLAVAVVIPTALLAVRFQDVSVYGFLRQSLGQAAGDIDQRQRRIQRDLDRWVPDVKERQARYPSGSRLAELLPVPGFVAPTVPENEQRYWAMQAFPHLPWIESAGPAELGLVRRAVWRATTETSPQQRRSAQSTGTADATAGSADNRSSVAAGSAIAQRVLRTPDGRVIRMRALAAEPSLSMRPDPTPDVVFRDRWWQIGAAFSLIVTLAFLLVVLVTMTARRLLGIYLPFGVRYLEPPKQESFPYEELLQAELRVDEARARAGDRFTEKDAADMRRVACAPRYLSLWKSLTGDERHLLHQLAIGQFANPENVPVIEGLLYKRYIRLRPWPVISDPGFADFARTAPDLDEFKADRSQWANEEAGSTWNRVRKPVMLVGVLLAIGLMALAGTTMQIVSTALAAITALLGSVTQVTNFVKKEGG